MGLDYGGMGGGIGYPLTIEGRVPVQDFFLILGSLIAYSGPFWGPF